MNLDWWRVLANRRRQLDQRCFRTERRREVHHFDSSRPKCRGKLVENVIGFFVGSFAAPLPYRGAFGTLAGSGLARPLARLHALGALHAISP